MLRKLSCAALLLASASGVWAQCIVSNSYTTYSNTETTYTTVDSVGTPYYSAAQFTENPNSQNCGSFTATTTDSWITIENPSGTNADEVISLVVSGNNGAPRTGTVTVSWPNASGGAQSATYTVYQLGSASQPVPGPYRVDLLYTQSNCSSTSPSPSTCQANGSDTGTFSGDYFLSLPAGTYSLSITGGNIPPLTGNGLSNWGFTPTYVVGASDGSSVYKTGTIPYTVASNSSGFTAGTPVTITVPSGDILTLYTPSASPQGYDPNVWLDISVSSASISCTNPYGPVSTTSSYTTTCTVSGAGTAPWSWTTPGLPSGLTSTVSSDTKSITIAGTPSSSAVGTYYFAVNAASSDSSPAQAQARFSGVIVPPSTGLQVACTPTQGPLTENVPYTAQCTASGGTPPYNWQMASLSGWTIPTGISGTASGTNNSRYTIAGTVTNFTSTYAYNVQVTDSSSVSALFQYTGTLDYEPYGDPPAMGCSPTGQISSDGGYSSTVTHEATVLWDMVCVGSAGSPPYTWGTNNGSESPLPNLTITTNPDQTGTFLDNEPSPISSFEITPAVFDSSEGDDYLLLQGSVVAPPSATCSNTNGAVNYGSTYSNSCTATGGVPYQNYTDGSSYIWWISSGALPAGLTLNPYTGAISGTVTAGDGSYSYSVTAFDAAYGVSNAVANSITVSGAPQPSISSISPTQTTAAANLTLTVNGANFGPDATVEIANSAADNTLVPSSITPTQLVVSVPAADIPQAGNYSIYVNTNGQVANNGNVLLGAIPTFTSLSPTTAYTNSAPFTLTVTGTGFASNTLIGFGSQLLDVNVTSTTTGTVTVPASDIPSSPTTYVVNLRSGSFGATNTINFNFVAPPAISCTTPYGPVALSGTYTTTCTASGGTAPWTWNISPSLPAGLAQTTSSNASITISGTPTAVGAYYYAVTATSSDSTPIQVQERFSGVIVPPSSALQIACTPTQGPLQTGAYTAQCTASGGTPPYTFVLANDPYYIEGSQFPAGLQGTQSGSTYTLNGPITSLSTSYAYTVTVNDSSDGPDAPATFVFSGNLSTSTGGTTTCSPLTGPVEATVPWNAVCTGTNNANTSFTWNTNNSSNPPPGLLIVNNPDTTATVEDDPTAAFSNYSFVVNGAPTAGTINYSGNIVAAPSVTCQGTSGPTTSGQAYSDQCSASGGTAPYIYWISSGALPAGLTLNPTTGLVSGTATGTGSYSYTVNAFDAAFGSMAQASAPSFSGSIGTPAPVTTSTSPSTTAPTAAGTNFTLTINGSNFLSGATVTLANNGNTSPALTPSSVTSTQIVVSVPGADIPVAGSYTVTVTNPGGLPSSGNVSVGVYPVFSSINPTSATAGGSGFTLSIGAVGLASNTYINFGPYSGLAATVTSSSAATVSIPASDVAASPTSYTVGLGSGGYTSAQTQSFSFVAATPSFTSVSPATLPAGTASTTLTLTGTNLAGVTAVSINGSSLTPVSGSVTSTQVQVVLPGSAIPLAGSFNLYPVVNGTQGTSTAVLIVTPVVSSVNPSSTVTTSTTPLTISVTGSGFNSSGTTVNIQSAQGSNAPTPLTTSSVTATSASAVIPTSILQTPGNYLISVTSGGQTSTLLPFVVESAGITCTTPSGPDAIGATYTETCTVAGAGTTPWKWTITPGLPAGLTSSVSSNTTSITISGAATEAAVGQYFYAVNAASSDSTPVQAQARFSGVIDPPATQLQIACTPVWGPTTQGAPYFATCVASGGVPPYTWTLTNNSESNFTSQLTITPSGNTATITGTITGYNGYYSYNAQVTDSVPTETTATFNFTGDVDDFSLAQYPTLGCSPTAGPAEVGVPWSAVCTSAGGTPPYSYSIVASDVGPEPSGLTFTANPDGTATALDTPTSAISSYGFLLENNGGSELINYQGAVVSRVTITCSNASGPSAVGSAWSTQCTAAGGTAPYVYYISAGALPAGLTLDSGSGAISGSLTQSGAYSFSVNAFDANYGVAATPVTYANTVVPPPSISAFNPPSVIAGSGAFTLVVTGTNLGTVTSVSFNGTSYSPSGTPTATSVSVSIPATATATAATVPVFVTSTGGPSDTLQYVISAGPSISSISPGTVSAGTTTTLTITGTNFDSGTEIEVNGALLPPAGTPSSTQFTVSLPGSDIPLAGKFTVYVVENGGAPVASTQSLIVEPVVISVTPNSAAAASGAPVNITVSGAGFTPDTVVQWSTPGNGVTTYTALTTSNVTATSASAVVPANLLVQGIHDISVTSATYPSAAPPVTFTVTSAALTCTTPYGPVSIASYTVTCSAPAANAPYTWTTQGTLPDGLTSSVSSDTTSITISGTPTSAAVGPYYFAVTASTSPTVAGFAAQQRFSGVIVPTSTKLQVTCTPSQGPTVPGSSYTAQCTASGGTPPYNWAITQPYSAPLPTGLTETASGTNNQNYTISGTSVSFSTYAYAAQVTDSASAPASASFQFTNQSSVSDAGQISCAPSTGPVEATVQWEAVCSVSSPTSGITWDASGSTNPPPALTATTNPDGTGTYLDKESSAFPNYSFVADYSGIQVPYTGNIIDPPSLSCASTSDTTIDNQPYSNQCTATGGIAPYLYWVSSGVLPAGVTLDPSTGLLSGTPTTAGSYTFIVNVFDAAYGQTPVPVSVSITVGTPTPAIATLQPSSAVAGGPAFNLVIIGTNLTNVSSVSFNGTAIAVPPSAVSATQVSLSIPASAIATAGTVQVYVSSSGVNSNSLPFTIGATPAISSLSPSTLPVNSSAFTLTVNGSNFVNGATIQWNGSSLPTTVVSSSVLTATVPASLIGGLAQTIPVTVLSGGVTSAPVNFALTPVISQISPTSATAGGPSFTLTVSGAGWITATPEVVRRAESIDTNASINWNGVPLTTTGNVANGTLSATVPASDIATPGTASITVTVPSGTTTLTSNAVTFTITAASTVTSLSPNTITAGAAAFTMTVSGTNFTTSSVVNWNGSPLTTTYTSASVLTASVPSSLVTSVGTATVTVVTGGATSNSQTFSIVTAATLSKLTPSTAVAGSSQPVSLSVTGTGFASGAVVNWNGSLLATTYVSGTQLTATIPAADLATPGTATVTVTQSGTTTPGLPFIIAAVPTLTSLSPNNTTAGASGFTMTVNGTNFSTGTVVLWNGASLPTTYVSPTQVTATVASSLIATAGSASVTAQNNGVATSNALTFAINTLSLTSLSPSSITAGSAAFPLTIKGTGLSQVTSVSFNGSSYTPSSVTSTQVVVTIPTSAVASAGTAQVTVTAGTVTSSALTFTINAPAPILRSLSPTPAVAGGEQFVLTLTGSNFGTSPQVSFNGTSVAVTSSTSTQIVATIPASLIATAGSVPVFVTVNGTQSNTISYVVQAPSTITSISPNAATAGSASFTLTVNGTNFLQTSSINWNGTPLSQTTYVSSALLTATVPASLLTTASTIPVTVVTGGVASSPVSFTIGNAPAITQLSPSAAVAGGSGFTLTVSGSSLSANAVIYFNGQPVDTVLTEGGALAGSIPSSLIATAGTVQVQVSQNDTTTNSLPFNIIATPALTSLYPSTAPAGASDFVLTVNGSGFTSASQVLWNGQPLAATTFVNSSQLTATVSSSLVAAIGTATVTVQTNGIATSTGLTFTIQADPAITSLNPASAAVGSSSITFQVNGAAFIQNQSTVQWDGQSLTTTFVNTNQLTATLDSTLLTEPGVHQVTVSTLVPGSSVPLISNSATFTVSSTPVLTSLNPSTVAAGSGAFTLTINGSNLSGALVNFSNSTSSFTPDTSSTATQLNVAIPASVIQTSAVIQVSVTVDGITSNSLALTVAQANITSISPQTATAGSAGFTLTVNGSGFTASSVIYWNGTPLAMIGTSATALTASVPAGLLTTAGTASVTVTQGDFTTNSVSFTILPSIVGPQITSLSPNSEAVGASGFTLTVNGSGFVSGTTVLWNSQALTTTFVSATQLTATVPASLIAIAGTASVTAVYQDLPASNAVQFTISGAPAITQLSPSTVTAGSSGFTLTITGTGFQQGSVIDWDGTALTTTFSSSTQLTAQVPASLVTSLGTASVSVVNSGVSSNTESLTISPVTTLTLQTTSTPTEPSSVGVTLGSAATVALNGTLTLSFTPSVSGLPAGYTDPNLQFSCTGATCTNGNTVLNFTVPANQASVSPLPGGSIMQGTVAGTITVTLTSLTRADTGVSVLPASAVSATLTVAPSAPVIVSNSVSITNLTSNGFTVILNGFSTTREVTAVNFTFTAASGTKLDGTTTFTVPASSAFASWFNSSAGQSNGSNFGLTVPFTFSGSSKVISGVSVTLTNSVGTSTSESGSVTP